MPENLKPADHLWLAIGFASINALMLAGMSLFSKLLAQYYGPLEVTFFRNSFSLVILVAWFFITGRTALMHTDRPYAQIWRATIGTAGIVLGMWAVSLMPLAETTILLFTSPLFTVLLSMLVLKERVGIYRLSAVAVGFLGVLIVANPLSSHGMHLPLLGIIVGLGWGFFSGAVDTTLRWIGKTEHAATTTFYFMLYGSIAVGTHLPFAEIKPGGFSTMAFACIAGIGLCGLFSLLAKSQSFRFGEATLVAPMMYTMIIWSVLFDYLFWDKVPQINMILGGAVIIAANLFILYREVKIKGRTPPPIG
jgi:drug/metabolite transporter (DMT)-like permease